MMRRGLRRSVLLLAAAAGLVVSLAPVSSPALEACYLSSLTPMWKGFDSNIDEHSGVWAKMTPGGCIRIMIKP